MTLPEGITINEDVIEPVYQTADGRARVYHCKAEELLATLPDNSIDLIVTDPPYSKRTHKGARKKRYFT